MRFGLTRRHVRILVVASLCGLAFEATALLDVDGARADDLDLLVINNNAGGGTVSIPPPNIVFLFDTNTTMNNLVCANMEGAAQCDAALDKLAAHSLGGSVSICKHNVFDALRDGAGLAYNNPDKVGTAWTFNNKDYFYTGTSTPAPASPPSNDRQALYTSTTVYRQASANAAFSAKATMPNNGTLEDALRAACAQSDCEKRNRCIVSLKTLGYFWEPDGSSCGVGDPPTGDAAAPACAGVCGDGVCGTGESRCTCARDCTAVRVCGDGCCDSEAGEMTAPACAECAGKQGAACANNGQCTAAGTVCYNGRCATCNADRDCDSNSCTSDLCSYYRCSDESCAPGDPIVLGELGAGGGASDDAMNGPVFLGDYLNFYLPKATALKMSFWQAINTMTGDVRLGVKELDGDGHDIQPPCAQSRGAECFDGNPATVCYSPTGAQMLNYLNGIAFTQATKPLATALDAAGTYYSSNTGVSTPICDYSSSTRCSTNNFVVLVTDGLPSGDAADWTDLTWASTNEPTPSPAPATWPSNDPDNGSLLDEVARALRTIDHRSGISEAQQVSTYTVSYGALDSTDPNKCAGLLDATARYGDGRCLPAKNAAELRAALQSIMDEIVKRARGFTAPAVPTTRFSGTSSLSAAVFRPSTSFPLWEGHVFAFKICDEKLGRDTGTTCECDPPNATDDVCVQDADGDDIFYDDQGYLTSKPIWDAQLCLSGNIARTSYSPVPPPDQHNLDVRGCYLTAAERVIKTVVDDDGDGLLEPTEMIDFVDTNVSLSGVNPSKLLAALAIPSNVVADGQKVVNFYRGLDVYDADLDLNVTEDRNLNTIRKNGTDLVDGWWKLGDTFHSMPNMVEQPSGRGLGGFGATASYREFQRLKAGRQKVMLVGANDGMLHAFQSGTWSASANGGKGAYDDGTGEELWAFVSPELLPQLRTASANGFQVTAHPWMVDGSVMVRDVWTGGTADKDDTTNHELWKTIAVYGHRDGGNTFVALDVTDVTSPSFLWQFPQPGMATHVAEMGKSWLDTYPAPAAIGPVRYKSGTNVYEKWAVVVSGGFDQLDRKGRMLLMLDAGSGAILWEARHGDGVHDGMDYSFPATPVYYTELYDTSGKNFPFIAGVIAADRGGQLWKIDTFAGNPKVLVDGKLDFTAVRFFQAGDPAETPIAPTADATLVSGEYQRWPFFFAPTLTRNGNRVRVIIGTGDRDLMMPAGPIGGAVAGVNGTTGFICADEQRLYAVDVAPCPDRTDDICEEGDLTEVEITDNGASGTYATAMSRGWFYKLPAGEKVAAPFQIYRGYAMYSTFLPTIACGVSSESCTPDSKGNARLYTRHYLSGKPLDWNGDNSLVGDTSISLGQGVATAPSVSVGVSAAGTTPTIFAGGSDSGLTTKQVTGLNGELASEIMRFYVTPELHQYFHTVASP